MITQYTHVLIPGWVAAGKFPDADEDRLTELSATWRGVCTTLASTETGVGKEASKLFNTWTGTASLAASQQVTVVKKWLVSIGASGESMSNGCEQAAAYVTHTKIAINNILRALVIVTKRAIAAALINPLDAPRLATEVTMAQAFARVQITRYYDALTSMLGQIRFTADIQPDIRSTVSTGAGSAAGAGTASSAGIVNATYTKKIATQGTTLPSGEYVAPEQIKEVRNDTIVLTDGREVPLPPPPASDTSAAGGSTASGQAGSSSVTTDVGSLLPPAAGAAAGGAVLPWSTSLAPVRNPDSIAKESEVGAEKNAEVVQEAEQQLKQEASYVPTGLDEAIRKGEVAGVATQQQLDKINETITSGGGEAEKGREGVAAAKQEITQGTPQVSYQSLPDQVKSDPTGYQPPEPVRNNPAPAPAPTPGPAPGGPLPSAESGGGGIPSAGAGGGPGGTGGTGGTFGSSIPDPTTGTSTGMPSGSTSNTTTTGGPAATTTTTGGGQPTSSGGGISTPASTGTGAAGVSAPVAPVPMGGVAGGMPAGFGGAPVAAPSYGNTPLLGGGGFGGPAAPAGVGGVGAPAPAAAPVAAPAAGGAIPAAPSAPAPISGAGAAPAPAAGGIPAGPGAAPNPALAGNPAATAPAPGVVTNAGPIGPTQQGQPGAAGPGLAPPGTGAARPEDGDGVTEAMVTLGAAIAALGLAGAAAMHFSQLWSDLRATPVVRLASGGLIPTQFGPDDQPTALLPAGLSAAYQKVLLPGEADALVDGQISTIRGLVHPLDQVGHLSTPSELFAALGLGFPIMGRAGADSLAFNRDAESIDVLRFAGLRLDDLITPVEADVVMPPGTVPLPLVRHHARPWTGTGQAPGSTSTEPIDEHEILGYAAVPLPHLAEIWRLHRDGSAEHISTYNARNASWVGSTSPARTPHPNRIDNGAFATLADGNVFEIVPLSDQYSVLVARGRAPEGFQAAQDGTWRIQVANEHLRSIAGVTTIGLWHGQPVQLLERSDGQFLVDYAGDDAAAAAAVGFVQVNQGQWQPRRVAESEVSDVQTLQRSYALPSALEPAIPDAPAPLARVAQ